MRKKLVYGVIILGSIMILSTLFLSQIISPVRTVRGKSPAAPLNEEMTENQKLAQDLALSDSRVQGYTIGRPSEVFGIANVGLHYPPGAASCKDANCQQVNIYNWDENAAVVVIVDLDREEVLEVFHQPGVHPGINKRLVDMAINLAVNDPQVIEILGFEPEVEDIDMAPVDADAPGSACDGDRISVAPTFDLGGRILWVLVDLHEEKVAALRWTTVRPEDSESLVKFPPDAGCPVPGSVTRDGWTMEYEVAGTDGLRVYNVAYNAQEVATSIKLVEWRADYGSSGFRDSTGCGGGGGGFPIYPYGDTQILDLVDDQQNVIGFEAVQDFRMSNWGQSCNYRYEQHVQFFDDGRFRVVSGAYGKGCGLNAIYRPVVRIDIAVNGDDGDSLAIWNGRDGWSHQENELWRTPYSGPDGPHMISTDGYAWKVTDASGYGYYLEPGRRQFNDDGGGDEPFIYVTLHHPSQGDSDLGVIGACCYDDHQQGPDIYVNGESIDNANIVIWYVPQMETDAEDGGDGYYYWTLLTGGVPGPTYPCFSGPMFVPASSVDQTYLPFTARPLDP